MTSKSFSKRRVTDKSKRVKKAETHHKSPVSKKTSGSSHSNDFSRENEDKYKILFESMCQGVFYQASDGRLTDVNPAALEMTGLTRDEFLGRNSMNREWKVITEDGKRLEPLKHPSMVALKTGKPVKDFILGIFNSRKKDFVWVVVNALPRFRENETLPFEVVVTFYDITERKKSDKQLLESETLLKNILSSSQDSVFAIDRNYRLLINNQKHNENLVASGSHPFTKGDLVQSPDYTKEVNEYWKATYDRTLSGEVFRLETPWRDVDGNERVFENNFAPLRDTENNITGALIVSHDITGQKKIENQIIKERELFQTLFSFGPVAYSVATLSDRTIMEVNRAWERLFGFNRDEVLGRPATDFDFWLVPEERIKAFYRLNNEGFLSDYEIKIKTKSGEERFVYIYCIILEREGIKVIISVFIDNTEHSILLKELKHNEMLLSEMSNIGKIGGWEFDVLTGNQNWSDEIYLIHDQKKGEYEPGIITELSKFESVSREFISKAFREARENGKPYDLELEMTTVKGNRKWVRTVCSPVLENGKVTRLVGTLQDITTRKNAEKALKVSESQYRELFNNISSGVAIYEVVNNGEDFIFRDFNKAAERIDGDLRENLIGKSIFEARPGITEFGLVDVIRRVYQTGISEEYPAKFYKDNKLQSWYQNYVYKLPTGEVVAVFDDITEKIKDEVKLRESEQRYSDLFHKSNIPVVIMKLPEIIIHDANEAAQKLTGFSRNEMIGKTSAELGIIIPLQRETVIDKFRENSKLTGNEMTIVSKSGEKRTIVVDTNPIEINNQSFAFTSFVDITDRKLAEDEVVKSRKSLEELNKRLNEIREEERTSISRDLHDHLGQSLTALKIDLNELHKHIKNNPEAAGKLNEIIAMVSASIRDVQRISSALRPEILYDLGLIPAIEWYTESFEKRTGIKCHLVSDESEYPDQDKNLALFRILQESLTNVIRHANASSVFVSLARTNMGTEMTIMDNGIGIDMNLIKSSKSLGIISITERARQLGGTINFSSGKNSGTTLRVNLP